MTYYVVDTTISPQEVKKFQTYKEIVNYLDTMSQRKFGQNRKQRMQLLEEIGLGDDDFQGVNFVHSMAETFNMGVVRDEGLMRCDITSVALYQKEEYGD